MTDITQQQAQQLITYATDRLGRVEGNGECWTLVNNAFQHLNIHKPSATYRWGRVVELSAARPGDIFQFSDFQVSVRTEDDNGWSEESQSRGAPRHTAILVSVDPSGRATFMEANVNDDRSVQRNSFYIRTADITGTERITVRVSGSFTIYRPEQPSSE